MHKIVSMKHYQWVETPEGQRMLDIEVQGKHWTYGALVLDSMKRYLRNNSKSSIETFLDLEKQHFSSIEMRALTEEFEILRQVPEFQELLNP